MLILQHDTKAGKLQAELYVSGCFPTKLDEYVVKYERPYW